MFREKGKPLEIEAVKVLRTLILDEIAAFGTFAVNKARSKKMADPI
jgi:hypothetical protein